MPSRIITPLAPVHPTSTIPSLGLGRGDPSVTVDEGAWIAFRTPQGPASLRCRAIGGRIEAEAWGPGAQWALEAAPGLVGALDDPAGFDPEHPLVRRLHRERPDLRITRSGLVTESLMRAVIGQKVTGTEAKRSYRRMVLAQGEPAPGPQRGLLMPPDPAWLATLDHPALHAWGIERRRADVLVEVARRSRRLEEAAAMPLPDAYRRITALRGVGPWSAAYVGLQALGDADAVLVGDFHIPNTVAWALAGEPRADDERLLQLLEPYRPHRGRVVALLKTSGIRAPRYGPRLALREIRDI